MLIDLVKRSPLAQRLRAAWRHDVQEETKPLRNEIRRLTREVERLSSLLDETAERNADMWATAQESPEQIIDLYRRARTWADGAIGELPLDAPARVAWWQPQETTLHRLLVHMITETARHAGHMDIIRETIDGQRGMLKAAPNLPDTDEAWWREYVARLRQLAEASGGAG